MTSLVQPHGGGELKPLRLEGDALEAEQQRAASPPGINVSSREAGDMVMMGMGGFTPPRRLHDSRRLARCVRWRKALSEGKEVSDKFSRPEVLEILRAYYGGLKDEEKVEIKMSGHSAK